MSETETETTETETDTWVTCVVDSDYEICTDYPYQIRKKSNGRIIKEFINKTTGYIHCCLNRKKYQKHRIIAQQFILNTDNLPQIDHKNHIKTDNRINNLRWCSASENNFNKSRGRTGYVFEFVDDISDDAIHVEDYSGWRFENLYFHNDVFYFYNGIKYRKLKIIEGKTGSLSVRAGDVEGINRAISYAKFKRENNIVGSERVEE